MAWKKAAPVGTIRKWESRGEVIKSFEGNQFDSGWLDLIFNEKLNKIGLDCDRLATSIVGKNNPIDGMIFLDHEIKEFQKEGDAENGPYHPNDFKQYSGFSGSGQYSFRNEFSKRFMSYHIKQSKYINDALLEANEAKNCDNFGDFKKICLHASEIRQIRKDAKKEFEAQFKEGKFDIKQCEELLEIIKRTHDQLVVGTDFEGEDKIVYEKNRALAESLDKTYESLKTKRDLKRSIVAEVSNHFKDNWAIRESFKKFADEKYQSYIRKYKKEILNDSGKEQEKLFGVKIESDPEQFYPTVIKKVNDFEEKLNKIDLKKLVGKEFTVTDEYGFDKTGKIGYSQELDWNMQPYDKYTLEYTNEYGKQKRSLSLEQIHQIKEEISGESYPFEELVLLRFEAKYGFNFEGKWPPKSLPSIFNFEKCINKIPLGHAITNPNIKSLSNESYGSSSSYAHFSPSQSKIFLSNKLMDTAGKFGDLSDSKEFDNVLLHEFGHALSQRLGRSSNKAYRKFVVACGWSWSQPALKQGLEHSTGEMEDIPREGSNSYKELITEYSKKSPEEAFAEFYSLYANNKEDIDKWLDTDDIKHIQKATRDIAQAQASNLKVSDNYEKHLFHDDALDHVAKVDKEFNRTGLDLNKHLSLELVSPFYNKGDHSDTLPHLKRETEKSKEALSRHRNSNDKEKNLMSHSRIVAVKSDDNHYEVLTGNNDATIFYHNKTMMPAITITKELYTNLTNRKCTPAEIISYAVNNLKDRKIPFQFGESKKLSGLMYDNKIIPHQKIEKLKDVILSMREMYNDESIQKALIENIL